MQLKKCKIVLFVTFCALWSSTDMLAFERINVQSYSCFYSSGDPLFDTCLNPPTPDPNNSALGWIHPINFRCVTGGGACLPTVNADREVFWSDRATNGGLLTWGSPQVLSITAGESILLDIMISGGPSSINLTTTEPDAFTSITGQIECFNSSSFPLGKHTFFLDADFIDINVGFGCVGDPVEVVSISIVDKIIREEVARRRRVAPDQDDLDHARAALSSIVNKRELNGADETLRDAEYKLRNWLGARSLKGFLNGELTSDDLEELIYEIVFSNPASTSLYNAIKWFSELFGSEEWLRADKDNPNSAPGGFDAAVSGWVKGVRGRSLDELTLGGVVVDEPNETKPFEPSPIDLLGIPSNKDIFEVIPIPNTTYLFDPTFGQRYRFAIEGGAKITFLLVPNGRGYDESRFLIEVGSFSLEFGPGEKIYFDDLGLPAGAREFVLSAATDSDAESFDLGLGFSESLPTAVSRETLPEQLLCDVDGNKSVDINDIRIIFGAIGQSSSGKDDPRDLNGDGIITVNDARGCVLRCDNANCTI